MDERGVIARWLPRFLRDPLARRVAFVVLVAGLALSIYLSITASQKAAEAQGAVVKLKPQIVKINRGIATRCVRRDDTEACRRLCAKLALVSSIECDSAAEVAKLRDTIGAIGLGDAIDPDGRDRGPPGVPVEPLPGGDDQPDDDGGTGGGTDGEEPVAPAQNVLDNVLDGLQRSIDTLQQQLDHTCVAAGFCRTP